MTAIVVGLGATLLMDAWNLFLERAFAIKSLDFCVVGRLIPGIPARAACAAGWMAHYAIGATLAIVFVALVSPAWLAQPRLAPALAYGLVTVALPMFVMQPALGLGLASAKVAHPWRARAKSVGTHLVFGVGLFATALIVSAV